MKSISKPNKVKSKPKLFISFLQFCRRIYDMEKLQNFIDGAYIAPKNGLYIDNYEPATGEIYSWIPDSDSEDVELAVTAAEKAFPIWSQLSIEKT
jgi:hypothetical protein